MNKQKLIVASLLIVPLLAQAQGGNLIEEVVVTAAKREQTLQEVPVAVSVVGSEMIERAEIQDISDLQTLVPSLRVTTLQTSRNTNFVIRGFGNGANNPGIEPSVGVFIDGVYRSRSAAAISDLPAMERVEILRGPQSTLFGKNASAGVISIVTPKPASEFGGFGSVSFGNYNALVVKGLVGGSLTDNIAADIFVNYNRRDGFFEDLHSGQDLNERNRYGLRAQMLASISDSAELRVIADYDTLDETCCGVVNIKSSAATDAIRAVGGNIIPDDPHSLEVYLDSRAMNEVTNMGLSAQYDQDFGSLTLTSISSYRVSEALDNNDIDFSSARLSTSNLNDYEIDTFTQEFRLTSANEGRFNWMVGAFYFDESVEYDSNVILGDQFRPYFDILSGNTVTLFEAIFGLPSGSVFGEGTGSVEHSTMENTSWSVFAQLDYEIVDGLVLTAGVNYTDDEKEATLKQTITEPLTANVDIVSLIAAGRLPAAAAALLVIPATVDVPNAVEGNKTSDSKTTYTLRLAYDLTEFINVYASVGTGFKASSWNLSRDSKPLPASLQAIKDAGFGIPNMLSGTRFASPENSTVYELGLKARFERGALNVAVFDQTIEGFQDNLFVGTGFVLANAGEQNTKGMELDFSYYPTDELRLGFASTFLDPEYVDFRAGNGVNGPEDLSGTEPSGIHGFSASLNAQYSFTAFGHPAFVRADYLFEDDVQVVNNVSADIASRQVNLLNMSAGVNTDSGISGMLWVRNATDADYLLSAFPSVAQAGSFSGYRSAPRMYGITLRKDF